MEILNINDANVISDKDGNPLLRDFQCNDDPIISMTEEEYMDW